MKLHSPSRYEGFYESFSDLIFSTMAIFALLMFVVLALVQTPEQAAQAEAAVALAQELEQAEFQRELARRQLEEMTRTLAKLEQSVKARGLELVIAVDVSGSMGEALGHLVETITTIARVLPTIAPEFKVGIVAYRMGEQDSSPLRIFPLQKIHAEGRDGGRSYAALSTFLGGLKAENGLAPVATAVDEAMRMLATTGGDSTKTFLLLGDVGPYEDSWQDMMFADHKRQTEQRIIAQVRQWATGADNRKVVSLFTRQPLDASMDRQFHVRSDESYRFFRELAAGVGQPDNFTDNPGKMLAYLLTAIVTQR